MVAQRRRLQTVLAPSLARFLDPPARIDVGDVEAGSRATTEGRKAGYKGGVPQSAVVSGCVRPAATGGGVTGCNDGFSHARARVAAIPPAARRRSACAMR